MNRTQTDNSNGYQLYEYKEIVTEGSKASFLLDGYESFGWEIDERLAGYRSAQNMSVGAAVSNHIPQANHLPNQDKITISLRRNRKIINKVELTRLERHFESCVREIDGLEKSKTSLAKIYALITGIVGTAFMAGSVFAITASTPLVILCIILAIPAFIGWILPYFIYRRTVMKQTNKLTPLIENKYDEIAQIMEKGHKLL